METLKNVITFFLFATAAGLKCRSKEPMTQPEDMEFAVRQCVRQFTQNSTVGRRPDGRTPVQQFGQNNSKTEYGNEISGIIANLQDWGKRTQEDRHGKQDRDGRPENQEQQDNRKRPYDQPPQRPNSSREFGRPLSRRPNQYENSGNFGQEDSRGDPRQWGRNPDRYQPVPHTSGQQSSYDRDVNDQNNRKPYFNPNNNNNNNYNGNNPNNNNFNNQNNYHQQQQQNNAWNSQEPSSRLSAIEPCMIHCVFQELKMLDGQGRLTKESVLNEMTRHVQEREIRDFLSYTVEECFLDIHQERSESEQNDQNQRKEPNIRHQKKEDITEKCKMSKSLAICLEERGQQGCDDWNDSMGGDGDRREPARGDSNHRDNQNEKPKDGKKGIKIPTRG